METIEYTENVQLTVLGGRGSGIGGRRSIDPPSHIFDPPSSDSGTHADLF